LVLWSRVASSSIRPRARGKRHWKSRGRWPAVGDCSPSLDTSRRRCSCRDQGCGSLGLVARGIHRMTGIGPRRRCRLRRGRPPAGGSAMSCSRGWRRSEPMRGKVSLPCWPSPGRISALACRCSPSWLADSALAMDPCGSER
jgi:hypothetical protein